MCVLSLSHTLEYDVISLRTQGVQALLTIELATALDSAVFRVLGSIYGAAVLLTWSALAIPTLVKVLDRSIFHAPYLDDELSQLTSEVGDESRGKRG